MLDVIVSHTHLEDRVTTIGHNAESDDISGGVFLGCVCGIFSQGLHACHANSQVFIHTRAIDESIEQPLLSLYTGIKYQTFSSSLSPL